MDEGGIDVGGGKSKSSRCCLACLLMGGGDGKLVLGTLGSVGGGRSGGALLSARKGTQQDESAPLLNYARQVTMQVSIGCTPQPRAHAHCSCMELAQDRKWDICELQTCHTSKPQVPLLSCPGGDHAQGQRWRCPRETSLGASCCPLKEARCYTSRRLT